MEIVIEEPLNEGYTIYSKSGCINCNKLKKIFKEKRIGFVEVQCDEYLIENKDFFLSFIKQKTQKEFNVFPMIFYNANFIGGYSETKENIEKSEVTFDDNSNF